MIEAAEREERRLRKGSETDKKEQVSPAEFPGTESTDVLRHAEMAESRCTPGVDEAKGSKFDYDALRDALSSATPAWGLGPTFVSA